MKLSRQAVEAAINAAENWDYGFNVRVRWHMNHSYHEAIQSNQHSEIGLPKGLLTGA